MVGGDSIFRMQSIVRSRYFKSLLAVVIGVAIFVPMIGESGTQDVGFNVLLGLVAIFLLLSPRALPSRFRASVYRLRSPAIVAGSLLLSWYLFGINLQAEFGVIDDHEIMYFAGFGRPETVSEAWDLLMETEVGNPGGFPRYRPSYYAIRIGEALVWGLNPFLWYLARVVMAAISMSIFWYLLAPHFGFIVGGLALLYVFTSSYWGDIFARLGPAEAYAVFGTSIFALGWHMLRPTAAGPGKRRFVLGWVLLTIGALIPIGAKENFLILLIPVAIAANLSLRRREERPAALIAIAIIGIYSIFVSWAVVTALAENGTTIRGEPISLSSRATVALQAATTSFSLFMLATLLAITVIRHVASRRLHHIDLVTVAATAQWAIGGCYLLYLSQVVFYNGNWPVGFRYDFPGALYRPLFFLSLAWFVSRGLRVVRKDPEDYQAFPAGIIIGLALAVAPAGFEHIRETGNHNVRSTHAFAAQLDAVIMTLNQNPAVALVIESHHPLDYEQVYSWPRFLRANHVASSLFVRLHGYSENSVTLPGQQILSRGLEQTSREGGEEFSPLRDLEHLANACFSLQLSGRTATECTDLN